MITSTLTLPDTARLPDVRRMSWPQVLLMDRVWGKAQTLFHEDNPSVPDTGYKILPDKDGVYIIFKPRPKEGAPDYTESRYVYDSVQQTCSCPFFSGIEPRHWSDAYRVTRSGSRIEVIDANGEPVTPDKPAHGYCKHHLAALLVLAGVIPPERRNDSHEPQTLPAEGAGDFA